MNLIMEDIENFTAKLSYVDERVSELQQTIMELTSAREEEETPDLSELVSTLNTQEVGYVFSKLYEQSVSTMTECANAATREIEVQQKLTHVSYCCFVVSKYHFCPNCILYCRPSVSYTWLVTCFSTSC